MCKNKLVLCLLIVACQLAIIHAVRPGLRYGNGGYYGNQQRLPPMTEASPPQTAKEYLDSKSGFSTFGIISIIFAVILFCLIFYYGIMCYPLLCKEEKKYSFMDASSTITAATSNSMQSIENYSVDQKHFSPQKQHHQQQQLQHQQLQHQQLQQQQLQHHQQAQQQQHLHLQQEQQIHHTSMLE